MDLPMDKGILMNDTFESLFEGLEALTGTPGLTLPDFGEDPVDSAMTSEKRASPPVSIDTHQTITTSVTMPAAKTLAGISTFNPATVAPTMTTADTLADPFATLVNEMNPTDLMATHAMPNEGGMRAFSDPGMQHFPGVDDQLNFPMLPFRSNLASPISRTSTSSPYEGRAKRTRATPSQLVILEDEFAKDPSPNAKMREDLAKTIGMPERSITIWFQNRRAKSKKKGLLLKNRSAAAAHPSGRSTPKNSKSTKVKSYKSIRLPKKPIQKESRLISPQPMAIQPAITSRGGPIGVPNSLAANGRQGMGNIGLLNPAAMLDLNLAMAMNMKTNLASSGLSTEDGTNANAWHLAAPKVNPKQCFSCDTLNIGTWTRVSVTPGDLNCNFDTEKKVFNWHVMDGTNHFKMECAFSHVTHVAYQRTGASGFAIFTLSQAPTFFMEKTGLDGQSTWHTVQDITEGAQASVQLCHTLKGDADMLMTQIQLLMHMVPHFQGITYGPDGKLLQLSNCVPPTGGSMLPDANSLPDFMQLSLSAFTPPVTLAPQGLSITGPMTEPLAMPSSLPMHDINAGKKPISRANSISGPKGHVPMEAPHPTDMKRRATSLPYGSGTINAMDKPSLQSLPSIASTNQVEQDVLGQSGSSDLTFGSGDIDTSMFLDLSAFSSSGANSPAKKTFDHDVCMSTDPPAPEQ